MPVHSIWICKASNESETNMSHQVLRIVWIVSAAAAVFACSNATTTNSPTPNATAPAPTRAVQTPVADEVLVTYHKSGGIAGIDETLVVHQGGLLELTTRGAQKIAQADEPMIQPLRRMLEQKDFSELAPRYQAAGADLFTYTITARDANGNAKTVTTMDAAKHPAYLGQLIAMLEQLRGVAAKS